MKKSDDKVPLRCPVCDYATNSKDNKQSAFFYSLPEAERKKSRFTVKHHRTGELVVGCADCYAFELSEKSRPTSAELERQADEILKEHENGCAQQ